MSMTYSDGTSTAAVHRWDDDAACRQHDPDLFFPNGSTGPYVPTIRYAKTVCWERCPVRNECLDTALDSRIAYGIWGGFTEEERRSATRKQLRGRRADDSEPMTAKEILAAKVEA